MFSLAIECEGTVFSLKTCVLIRACKLQNATTVLSFTYWELGAGSRLRGKKIRRVSAVEKPNKITRTLRSATPQISLKRHHEMSIGCSITIEHRKLVYSSTKL